jgi:hypothetical protein
MDEWFLNQRPTSLGTRLSHPSPDPQGGWSLSLDSANNPQQIGIMRSGAYGYKGPYVSAGDDSYRHALIDPTFSMFSFAVCFL